MTKQIFLLNGPPSSGKDSLAAHMAEKHNMFTTDKFAYPLKMANKVLFSLSDEEFKQYDTDPELKNLKCDRFLGKSWRDVNIALSERFIKLEYDMSFFGQSLVSRLIQNNKEYILVPDSGFFDEAKPLVDVYGADNVFLIQLHREGFTFANDSRAYVDGDKLGVKTYHLHNDNYDKFLLDGEKLILFLTK